MVYYETDYVSIEHNPELKAVEIRWKGRSFSPEEYRFTILKSQNLIEMYDIDNLLADMRLAKEVNETNRNWVKRVVLPHLESLGLKRFAFLYEGNLFSALHAKGLTETIVTMNFEVQHFKDIAEAKNWFNYYMLETER